MKPVPRTGWVGIDIAADAVRETQVVVQISPAKLPEKIVGTPIELKPIPWGKPDPELGRGVCRHLAEVNAPTLIPFNPLTESKLHSLLRSLRIAHH